MRHRGEPWPLQEGDRGPLQAGSPSSSRANKQTNTAEPRLKARVFFHFPRVPDPNLNPRSESCQPGCSSTDIAAGIFSAAFPQICLLLGPLKRTPRFLCYRLIQSVPSSKAPRFPGGARRRRGNGGLRCRAGGCSGARGRCAVAAGAGSHEGQPKAGAKGGQGQGAAALVLLLAPVPGGEDEPVAPGQRVPILLSGHYNNDVLEHFAQPAISWRLQMLGDRHVTGPGAARLSHPCRRPRRERAHGLAGVGMDYGGAKGFLQGGELQRCVQRDRCHQPSP